MKERLHISMLMDYYSSFLTDKQREMMRLHYEEDYSLGEIAAIYHISRQGAYDSIKKARPFYKNTNNIWVSSKNNSS